MRAGPREGTLGRMSSYEDTARLRPLDGTNRFTADLPESWRQGRGAFGGIVATWLHRAFSAVAADEDRPLRSMGVQFAAGLAAGPVEISVEVVRRTGSLVHATARLEQAGEVAMLATAIAARARDLGAASDPRDPAMPDVRPPDGIRPLPATPLTPTFIQHFDIRFVSDRGLFSGAPDAHFAAWVRLVEPAPIDASLQALLSDVLPPGIFATLSRPRPGATTSMNLHFLKPGRVLDAGERVLVESTSEAWGEGYSSQDNRVWSADGELLVRGRQLVVVIK